MSMKGGGPGGEHHSLPPNPTMERFLQTACELRFILLILGIGGNTFLNVGGARPRHR